MSRAGTIHTVALGRVAPAPEANHSSPWGESLPSAAPTGWVDVAVDLVALAVRQGLVLGANFKVKLQQYDKFSLPSDGMGYDKLSITGRGAADSFRVSLAGGQPVSVALKMFAAAAVTLDLVNPQGVVVATAVPRSDDGTLRIENFIPPTTGEYALVIRGSLTASADYAVVVTRNAPLRPRLTETANVPMGDGVSATLPKGI